MTEQELDALKEHRNQLRYGDTFDAMSKLIDEVEHLWRRTGVLRTALEDIASLPFPHRSIPSARIASDALDQE